MVSLSTFGEICRMFFPSASHVNSNATCTRLQFTIRLQHVEQNIIRPSGRYVGSMSSKSPSVSWRSPLPSTLISWR